MKKMMIAFAAMAMAVAASAAQVQWGYEIQGEKGGSATEFTGYTAYLVDADYYAGLEKVTKESITGAGEKLIDSAALAQTGSSGLGGNKKYVFSTGAKSVSGFDDALEGTAVSYKLVLVDAAGDNFFASDYNTTYLADTASPTADSVTLSLSKATVNAGMAAWQSGDEPVPEPTSGMLLLLGLAGAALKRKRA